MRTGWKFGVAVAALLILLAGCRTTQSPEGQISDVQVAAHVKSKLATDLGVTSLTNVSVNSTNGVVTLAGPVDTADRKKLAEAIALAVPGVVKVNNNLQVMSPPAPQS